MGWVLVATHILAAAVAAIVVATFTHRPSSSDRSRKDETSEGSLVAACARPTFKLPTKLPQRSLNRDISVTDVDGSNESERSPVVPFSEWALHKLLGPSHVTDNVSSDDNNVVKCAVIRQQLKRIAALYLCGDVAEIRAAIKKFGLDEAIVNFMSKQCSASTDLKALSLQMSRAFARDALTSAANHQISRQYPTPRGSGAGFPPANRANSIVTPATLTTTAVPEVDSIASRFSQVLKSGSVPPVTDGYKAGQLGLVSALSFYREGTMGTGAAWNFDPSSVNIDDDSPLHPSMDHTISHHNLSPSPAEQLQAQAEWILSGAVGKSKPGMQFLEKFGCRTILTYLMRELEALLTMYLNQNWDRMDQVKVTNDSDTQEGSSIAAAGPKSPASLSNSSSYKESQAQSKGSLPDGLMHLSDKEDMTWGDTSPSVDGMASQGISKRSSISSSKSSAGGSWASLCLSSASRARRNWHRAMQAYVKHEAVRFLKPKREFQTMAQLLQQLAKPQQQKRTRDPIFLFLGGGMAAGKSTVREIIGSDSLWSKIGSSAVVIEADAIKNQDVVLKELRSSGLFNQDDANLSQFVHDYSTRKAQGALVAAVNEQLDIIFDGTCSWEPFVLQTIEMLRDHVHDYQLGPGYERDADGTTREKYWVRSSNVPEQEPERDMADVFASVSGPQPGSACRTPTFSQGGGTQLKKRPYRIELVGVTCAAELAVARGFWRMLQTGRGVPVAAQLRSFRLFAQSWPTYCRVVDSATLYHTGSHLTTMAKEQPEIEDPRVIAHVSTSTKGQLLVEPCAYQEFQQQATINSNAASVHELYHRTLTSSQSILRCPSHKKGRVSMLRAALQHASNPQESSSDPMADPKANLRRSMSSVLDGQRSYERRQTVSLPDVIAE